MSGAFSSRILGSPLLVAGLFLTACSTPFPIGFKPAAEKRVPVCAEDDAVCLAVKTPGEDTMRPKYRLGIGGFDTGGATTAAALDTATAAEVAAAKTQDPSAAERNLGKTIASLGDVAQQGFWLETPLVDTATAGRVVWADNGNSVAVELRPREGPKTAGSQISLAAMRALGVPLTALPELIVFAN